MSECWSFHNPVSIHFGEGAVEAFFTSNPYRRMLLVTTPGMMRRGTVKWLETMVKGCIEGIYHDVRPNPDIASLDALAARYRGSEVPDAIIALGGGSAIDTAKVLGAQLGGGGFSLRGHFIEKAPLPPITPVPVIAIPTTSGTGSEVTPFATVWDAAAGKKYSLAGTWMFPLVALLVPRLTMELPWEVTFSTGLDALCQGFESLWNRNATPVSIGFAERAVAQSWAVLSQGRRVLASESLRAELMEASLLSGLAISQTRTALCHSISYPITARYGVPHGLACAFTMPSVLRFNAVADDGRLARFACSMGYADCAAMADALGALLQSCGISELLRGFSLSAKELSSLAHEMITPGRADNNLRAVGAAEVLEILSEASPLLSHQM